MTNKEAIGALKWKVEYAKEIGEPYTDCVNVEALALAVKALEADRWRKLSEEEPKVSGSYLVSGVWGSGKVQVGDCEFKVEDGYFDACWNFDILAWKPLPKPYESEDSE